jgi:hypothetical protein
MLDSPETATFQEIKIELDKLACHFAHYAGEPGSQRFEGLTAYRKKLEARLAQFESVSYESLKAKEAELNDKIYLANRPGHYQPTEELLRELKDVKAKLGRMVLMGEGEV